jgi:hypothetical protein
LIRLEAELLRQFASLKRLQASQGINRLAHDFFRRFFGHGFDFHATFRARNDQGRRGRAIKQHGKINLALDIHGGCDEHLVDHASRRARLMSDQRLAEHPAGDLARFGR